MCGRIRGYQYGASSAFGSGSTGQGIEGHYVGGVSLTHGSAGRCQHIWTFAAGLAEATRHIWPDEHCPCDISANNFVPSFVGNDYFCESGAVNEGWGSGYSTFYSSDVLWDGQDCISTSTCCQFNNPPWFTKNLPTATIDDIELRICASDGTGNEVTPLELIELYVQ